jgi:predicted metal-dependent phosphoesterase TrpH
MMLSVIRESYLAALPMFPILTIPSEAIGRIPDADAVEVYNSKHLFGLANGRAKFEAKRRGMSMVAGSDSHFADTVGLGVTEINAEDVDGVLEAIRAVRTRILGRRTPPRFFIGNTVIFTERLSGMREGFSGREFYD